MRSGVPKGGENANCGWIAWLSVGIALTALCEMGCGSPKPSGDGSPSKVATPAGDREEGITAEEILRRAAKAYSNCKTYSDEGVLLVKFPQSTEVSRFPFSVAYERSGNKIRIEAYQVTLASDGNRMRGFIEDELSNNLDSQFLDSPLPAQVTPQTLIEDAEVISILSQGAGGPPPVMEWLLSKAPFEEVLSNPSRLKKLPSREVDGRSYYRLQVDLRADIASGSKSKPSKEVASFIVLWIDQATSLVGKLEYPHVYDSAKNEAATEDAITITAEFRKAQFDGDVEDSLFRLTPTKAANIVSFFVPPPAPVPLERLGKVVSHVELEALDGKKFSTEQLMGKTAVLLFVRNHPACEDAAKQFAEVYTALKSDARFEFRIIANESREVSNANISRMLERWGATIPAARDSGAATGDSLGISSLPTLVILDPKGQLQLAQSFGFSSLANTLPAVCEQVASGEEVFRRLLDAQSQYEARLKIAKAGGKPNSLVLSPTKMAPVSQPRKLKCETAWELPDLKSTACLTPMTVKGEQKFLALESPRTVRSISPSGKELGKLELQIPEGASASVLRVSSDNANEATFVAFGPGGEAAYFLNEKGELLGSFPPAGQSHEGVADAVISDLDGKDGLEAYVGFSAFLGIQATDLKGVRNWRNLAVPRAISLAVSPKNAAGWRKLYATDDRGRIFMLNQFGKHEVVQLEDREIHRLFYRSDLAVDQASNGDAIYCGVSYQEKDKLFLIGYDSEFGETWTYDLPPGVFVGAVQYATTLPVPGRNLVLWVVAAPDGSIHFIGSKGEFVDSFCTGERILAVCGLTSESKPTLVYATESGIHAKYITLPDLQPESKQ